ncbi:MAG: YlmH/Sll1252 family protein [Christensenellales bacterium]|nr:YlmH/Sll1252 family protein [Christensenellales bacterium]
MKDEIKRFRELALSAAHTGRTRFTRFLDPALEEEARCAANRNGAQIDFFGGYPDAERRVAAFYDQIPPEPKDYPVAALGLGWNERFGHCGHRDLLGAVTGLGLERDTLGNIGMGGEPGLAYLFCHRDVAGYIRDNLTSAGRVGLRVSPAKNVDIAPPEGEMRRVTVQTLRLDGLVAAGCRLSRGEAQRLIETGLVKLNHVPCMHCDSRVPQGSLISVRGFGRMRVEEIQGETRRGRVGVLLFCYGK